MSCLHCLSLFATNDKQQKAHNNGEKREIWVSVCQFAAIGETPWRGPEMTNRQTKGEIMPNAP